MHKGIILILTVLFFIIGCAGCAQIKISRLLPDGSVVTAEYTRFFNQNIDGFKLKSPEGWELSFDQKSEIELAFKLGVISAGIGRGD
jgi:hypothetical protein